MALNTRLEMRRGLYAITDDAVLTADNCLESIEAVLDAGVVMLQWRNKYNRGRPQLAKNLSVLCKRYDTALIINDDVPLVKKVGANGVHLGRDDMTISEARSVLGSDAIIGSSCYADLDLARRLCTAGADYVAFGSVFASPTKPDAPRVALSIVADACKAVSCQVAAIGGITTQNVQQVLDTGVDLVAVISGLWSTDDPAKAAAQISKLVTQDRIPHERF